jgi:ABC-type Fe3+/spermidine/putrescine transport system ATPase subunit
LSEGSAHLRIEGIAKRFGAVEALRGVSIAVGQGEFVALLGPSGCGKTTLLRILAGLETPDCGRLLLDGTDITALPVDERGFGMVFQSYALFPHLTVFDNVTFGLRMRRVAGADQERRALSALEAVQLKGFEARYPRQLSGGQQQRVALARALAIEPRLLLLDEPLSNLDARLRRDVRLELRALQKRLGITALFVTHDQEEALALADRVVVMRAGQVEQVGDPRTVYRAPGTRFAAEFVGEANLVPAAVVGIGSGGMLRVQLRSGDFLAARAPGDVLDGAEGYAVVRQEDVSVRDAGASGIPGVVEVTAYLGSSTICVCRCDSLGISIRARMDGDAQLEIGAPVRVTFAEGNLGFVAA